MLLCKFILNTTKNFIDCIGYCGDKYSQHYSIQRYNRKNLEDTFRSAGLFFSMFLVLLSCCKLPLQACSTGTLIGHYTLYLLTMKTLRCSANAIYLWGINFIYLFIMGGVLYWGYVKY